MSFHNPEDLELQRFLIFVKTAKISNCSFLKTYRENSIFRKTYLKDFMLNYLVDTTLRIKRKERYICFKTNFYVWGDFTDLRINILK